MKDRFYDRLKTYSGVFPRENKSMIRKIIKSRLISNGDKL